MPKTLDETRAVTAPEKLARLDAPSFQRTHPEFPGYISPSEPKPHGLKNSCHALSRVLQHCTSYYLMFSFFVRAMNKHA
jgi:hypothetical protein